MSRDLKRMRAEAAARAELAKWLDSLRGRLVALTDEVERVLNEVRAPGSPLENATDVTKLLNVFTAVNRAEDAAAGLLVNRSELDADAIPDPVAFSQWLARDLNEQAGAA